MVITIEPGANIVSLEFVKLISWILQASTYRQRHHFPSIFITWVFALRWVFATISLCAAPSKLCQDEVLVGKQHPVILSVNAPKEVRLFDKSKGAQFHAITDRRYRGRMPRYSRPWTVLTSCIYILIRYPIITLSHFDNLKTFTPFLSMTLLFLSSYLNPSRLHHPEDRRFPKPSRSCLWEANSPQELDTKW